MLRIACFSLLIIVQVVTADGPPPPHCRGPPPGVPNPKKCCLMPSIFKEEDVKDCGIEIPTEEENFRAPPPDCTKATCLLKKYNLMQDDTEVDKDVAIEYMDKWVEANPDFKDAAEKAKEVCLKSDLPKSRDFCEPIKIMLCMRHIMFTNCPKWEDSDECKVLKDHVEECKAYFP